MDSNANGTGESVSNPGALTLTETAQRLGLTLPRLQRILKRPEFAPHVSTGVRQTRTGTRTVTLVSVSILEDLHRWADEQKREHSGSDRFRPDGPGGAQLVPAEKLELLQAVLRTKDAEIAEKDRHLRTQEKLIAEKDARIGLLLEKIEGLERRLEPPALPDATAPEGPPDAQGGPETGGTENHGSEVAPGIEAAPQRRPWWQWWRRDG